MVYANQTSELPGVKITSHVQNQHVQTGRFSITGVSTDNSTTDCDVYIILNEIRPYQRANPTGNNNTTAEDNHDYSTWNYTFTPEYATILEDNNRMVSKITCIDHFSINDENLSKFNSLNVTGIRMTDNATHASSEVQSLEIPTNTTYSDLVQLQDPDSMNINLYDEISNPNRLQNTKVQNDRQDDDYEVSNEKADKKDDSDSDGADYSSSSNSRNDDNEEEDFKDFVEQLHDRVSDQVRQQLREQLRESGIDLN